MTCNNALFCGSVKLRGGATTFGAQQAGASSDVMGLDVQESFMHCRASGCHIEASYGYPGSTSRYCASHQLPGMV